jgi:lipid-A-disaccharide synthase
MRTKRIMLIAGDPSGDALAADLVRALAQGIPTEQFQLTDANQPLTTPLLPSFFGAGGPKMAETGVELAYDLTADAVIGFSDAFKKLPFFRKAFKDLLKLAIAREPDLIILVDFSGFNRRFAHAVREYQRSRRGTFCNWQPRIVQYVSPQVWASRAGRAKSLARDVDLLLCLFPFEKDWYSQRYPNLKVECVGPPIFDRYAGFASAPVERSDKTPLVLLLPGSRTSELKRHLPVMVTALDQIQKQQPVRHRIVVPESLHVEKIFPDLRRDLVVQNGGLAEALRDATIAISKTGTVMLECAYFGVPTVAIYKTSWSTALIGRHIIKVKYLAMPNLLADEPVFPELLQQDATPEKIASAALDLLQNESRRASVKAKLLQITSQLGGAGATNRAATAILKLTGPVWNSDIRATLG